MFNQLINVRFFSHAIPSPSLLLLLYLCSSPSATWAFQNRIDDKYIALEQGSWSGSFGSSQNTERFSLELPSPGVLVIEATSPITAGESPGLSLWASAAEGLFADIATLDRSVSRLTLAVRERGSLPLRIASRDPRQVLGEYRLQTHFVPLSASTEMFWGPFEGVDTLCAQVALTRLRDLDGDVRVESLGIRAWDEVSKTEIEEVDPNPGALWSPSMSSIKASWFAADPWQEGVSRSDLTASVRGWVTVPDSQIELGVTKTEIEEVDPNPGAFRAAPCGTTATGHHQGPKSLFSKTDFSKTEIEEVDPNPGAFRAAPCGTLRHGASFPVTLSIPTETPTAESRDLVVQSVLDAITRHHLATQAQPFRSRPARRLGACQLQDGDEHLDTFSCATPLALGQSLSGELFKHQGIDSDVFEFAVDTLSRVEIAAEGDTALAGGLYDVSGRRLGVSATDTSELLLYEILEPGRYFVRIESADGAFGVYRLAVTASR